MNITHKLYPLLFLLLAPVVFACSGGQADAGNDDPDAQRTTVILVRHAEKQGGNDPELTEAGSRRAERLAERLAPYDLAAVYSTNTKRTMATAGPTAKAQGLDIQSYSAGDLERLAASIPRDHRGRPVLIVGHSHSTPSFVSELMGKEQGITISEDDYGNYFVVRINRRGKAKLERQRY